MTARGNSVLARILILGFLPVALSCLSDIFDNKDHYYPLDDQYKIKFNSGDSLTYNSSAGRNFKLRITSIVKGRHVTSRRNGGKPPFNITETQEINFDSVYTNPGPISANALKHVIFVRHIGGSTWVEWQTGLYVAAIESQPIYYEALKLNTKTFSHVYQLKSDSTKGSIYPSTIVTWYYNHPFGFVGFTLKTGEVFELDAK